MEPRRDPRRPAPWKLAAGGLLLFAAGVGTGVLVTEGTSAPGTAVTAGAQTSGEPSGAPGATPTSTGSSTAGAAAGTAPAATPVPSTSLEVSAACARAGEGGQQALDAIDAAGDAVADLDAQRLDEIIDALRPLRLSLPGDVAACRDTVVSGQG